MWPAGQNFLQCIGLRYGREPYVEFLFECSVNAVRNVNRYFSEAAHEHEDQRVGQAVDPMVDQLLLLLFTALIQSFVVAGFASFPISLVPCGLMVHQPGFLRRMYEFILPDGTVRHEIIRDRKDVFTFKAMHGAVSARPVSHADPDGAGTCGAGPARRQELLEEMADLERRYFAEDVDDMPEVLEDRLIAIEKELAALESRPK